MHHLGAPLFVEGFTSNTNCWGGRGVSGLTLEKSQWNKTNKYLP